MLSSAFNSYLIYILLFSFFLPHLPVQLPEQVVDGLVGQSLQFHTPVVIQQDVGGQQDAPKETDADIFPRKIRCRVLLPRPAEEQMR